METNWLAEMKELRKALKNMRRARLLHHIFCLFVVLCLANSIYGAFKTQPHWLFTAVHALFIPLFALNIYKGWKILVDMNKTIKRGEDIQLKMAAIIAFDPKISASDVRDSLL